MIIRTQKQIKKQQQQKLTKWIKFWTIPYPSTIEQPTALFKPGKLAVRGVNTT